MSLLLCYFLFVLLIGRSPGVNSPRYVASCRRTCGAAWSSLYETVSRPTVGQSGS